MSGPAVIYLRKGTYLASHAELTRGVLTYTGHLRRRDLLGVYHYEEHTRTVRLRPDERVEWARGEGAA
jgi:hypothetical protein